MGEVILNFNKKTIGKIIIYKNTNNKLKKSWFCDFDKI